MLESIYLMFVGIAIMLSVLGFSSTKLSRDKKEIPMFSFLAFGIMLFLALMSVEIETPVCDNEIVNATVTDNTTTYTTSWNCVLYSYEAYPLTYFWGGLGLVMFIFAIFQLLSRGVEDVIEESEHKGMI